MNMVALKRRPNVNSLGAPDLVEQQVVTDPNNASSFLQYVLQNSPDNLVIVNATWDFSFSLDSIASDLEQVWKWQPYRPRRLSVRLYRQQRSETVERVGRGYSNLNLSGYLAADTNNNYKFIQRHR